MSDAMLSLLSALIGGSLAIVGGLIGAIYAARTVRKTRMEELIAERKITADAEAYSALKEFQGLFIQAAPEVTNKALQAREEWFFNNRLFFPGKFPALWLSIRNDIQSYHIGLFQRTKDEKELAALPSASWPTVCGGLGGVQGHGTRAHRLGQRRRSRRLSGT
jgi:hypothetical protein